MINRTKLEQENLIRTSSSADKTLDKRMLGVGGGGGQGGRKGTSTVAGTLLSHRPGEEMCGWDEPDQSQIEKHGDLGG